MLDDLSEHEKSYAEKLRRHLQFFFMNPMQKFKVRRQFPFKLALQVLKVIFVTIQVAELLSLCSTPNFSLFCLPRCVSVMLTFWKTQLR